MITEYCCYGNLRDYLLDHRHDFVDQVTSNVLRQLNFFKFDETQLIKTLLKRQTAEKRYEFTTVL